VHQREDTEATGRFGLPPEQPADRALLSPVRAFVILASAGLVAWMTIAGGSRGSSRDVASDEVRATGRPAASSSSVVKDSPPTEADVLAAFRVLDELRGRMDEGVVTPGLSLRGLERAVPSGGRTLDLAVLSLGGDQARVKQVIELSGWDVDLTAEDISVGRLGRRLGIEWTLLRTDGGWRIAAWTVVEDRAVVTGR
jgi:hypothetical protein